MWVLKVIKLHYYNLQEDDYANEDTFLYFVLSPVLNNLLRINSRTALLFGETNLKSKAAEINRHPLVMRDDTLDQKSMYSAQQPEAHFSGVMSQVFEKGGIAANDYILECKVMDGKILCVRNVPTPACTASLAIAEMLIDTAIEDFEWQESEKSIAVPKSP
ncbi:hypothetical protein INT47_005547 [Mucor saturninus]|uniref:Uncharacterized protein n=1 Tax=Mucor saturninus TaxID=64648 RepID=A0A8H7V6Q5_9FUNG|nr:hypothetical protein INT47_005547 [Mucor saturninus]